MNRKDVEAYKEGYSEVEIFIKQFPHLKKEIRGTKTMRWKVDL